MKCNHCGNECLRGEQTCSDCGTSLGAEYNFDEIDFVFDDTPDNMIDRTTEGEVSLEGQSLEVTAQKKHKRVKLIIGGIVLLIGIIVVIFNVINSSHKSVEYSYVPMTQNSLHSLSFYVNDTKSIVLLRRDGKVVHIIDSDQTYPQGFSMSCEVVALIMESDQGLYIATNDDKISVDSDVDSVLVSQDGTNVAYIKKVKNSLGELYLYDVISRTTTHIASEVSIYDYQLSPDGDSIAYCKMEGVQKELYVYIDKREPKKITSWETPVGISNHGEFLYVMGVEEFHVITGEKDIRLGDEFDIEEQSYKFNLDYTQVLYLDDGITYLSIEGTIKKLTDNIIYGVKLPPDASWGWNNSGISNFANHIVQTGDGTYYLNDQFELNYICENRFYKQVSKDMKSLLSLENDELYLYKDFQNNTATKKRIGDANNIIRFSGTSDLSIIYYQNHNNELYSIKEDGKAIKIADNVSPEFYLNNVDGYCYYVTNMDDTEGNLYYSNNQETGKPVKNLESGLLGGLLGAVLGVNYVEGNYMDLYSITNGEAKLILSKISTR